MTRAPVITGIGSKIRKFGNENHFSKMRGLTNGVASETAKAKYKNAVGTPPSNLQTVRYATGIPKNVVEVTNRESGKSLTYNISGPGTFWHNPTSGIFGGQLYGPSKRGGTSGPPLVAPWSRRALDEGEHTRLWALSEERTGVTYDV